MSIGFPKAWFTIKNDRALVRVKCTGTIAARCVGTLTLKVQGKAYKATYSVASGKAKTIKVALGPNEELSATSPPPSAVAVARTEQTSGAAVKTKRKLRLR